MTTRDVDLAIAQLDRAERRKRRRQVVASVVLVVIGAAFLPIRVYPIQVVGAAFVLLGVGTFFAVRKSELARVGRVRSLLRDDPDGIVWIWSDVRRPNHLDQRWVVFHCRDGRVYSAIVPLVEAAEWTAALRRVCPKTLITDGTPTNEMREAWRKNPAEAPVVSAAA
jgi:hypothetical protein